MMKSMSGRRKRDALLADVQRAFTAGYHDRRQERPSKIATMSVEELYAMVSELGDKERQRVLARLGPPHIQSGRMVKMTG